MPKDGKERKRKKSKTSSASKKLEINPQTPYKAAKIFHSLHPNLVYVDGCFREYDGSCYPARDDRDMRALVYETFAKAVNPEGQPINPKRSMVSDVLDALESYCYSQYGNLQAPCWLGQCRARRDQNDIISFKNGLLHVPTGELIEPTPDYFTYMALGYDYEPDADPPIEWYAFLESVWPGDEESIGMLQEWFGYVVSNLTSLHKMLLMVGPPRSGKGTILRVLRSLIGPPNVAAPSLAHLSDSFGLQCLIDKKLAMITDARVDQHVKRGVEHLLAISGEDAVEINRKHEKSITVSLPTRFMFCTNEIPRLVDASGAITRRFLTLHMWESFLGREKTNLTQMLLAERPQILNWALEGLTRLNDRGHFIQPESGEPIIREMDNLNSPVRAFVNEKCKLDRDAIVVKAKLYAKYKLWHISSGNGSRRYYSDAVFGRNLLAAFPQIQTGMKRMKGAKNIRKHIYKGIKLKRTKCQVSRPSRGRLHLKGVKKNNKKIKKGKKKA